MLFILDNINYAFVSANATELVERVRYDSPSNLRMLPLTTIVSSGRARYTG